jgi:hypothetical protein
VYFFVFIPLATDRIALFAGKTPPPDYLTLAVTFFSSNGFWNAMVYGLTRNIYAKYKALYKRTFKESGTSSTNVEHSETGKTFSSQKTSVYSERSKAEVAEVTVTETQAEEDEEHNLELQVSTNESNKS